MPCKSRAFISLAVDRSDRDDCRCIAADFSGGDPFQTGNNMRCDIERIFKIDRNQQQLALLLKVQFRSYFGSDLTSSLENSIFRM